MHKPLRQYLPDYIYLLAVAGTVILFDQVTKYLVRRNLDFTDIWSPVDSLAAYARIVHWKNTGAAFGIFQDGNLVFVILGILVSLAILNYYPLIPRLDRLLRAALALQLGGAAGNLVDRLHQGYVTDFVSILNLPVFNVADASISAGVVLILLPFLPQLWGEVDTAQLMRLSRQINSRYRNGSKNGSGVDEAFSLGLLEVLLAETETVRRFTLRQDVRRIRQRLATVRRGISRG